jgi:hypothetical protein
LENLEETVATGYDPPVKPPTRKRKGEMADLAFMQRAISLGFGIAKPWGDSDRYDFVLNCGNLFWRVQVKSTERFAESRYRVKAGGSHSDYQLGEIDFLVAYIVPVDIWYVVPIAAVVAHKSLRFYPSPGSKGRLEKYRQAWRLFRQAPPPIVSVL